MEALALLAAEFVAALVPLFVLGAQLVLNVVLGMAELMIRLFSRRSAFRMPVWMSRWSEAQRQTARRIWRLVMGLTLIALILSGSALVLVNHMFLDETVAFLVRRAEARTGMSIRYDSMQGDVLRGSFLFTGLHLRQEHNPTARFDLRVERVAVGFSLWQVLQGRKVIQSVDIDGVRGTFSRMQNLDTSGEIDSSKEERVEMQIRILSSRERFRIDTLSIADGALVVEDRTRATPIRYAITVLNIQAEPLRGSHLWFDLLFRSTMEIAVDEARLRVENRSQGGERFTHWSASGIDAAVFASLVGGPFTVFNAGTIDFVAEDTWSLQHQAEITMDWSLRLHDIVAAVPPGTPTLLQAPTRVFVERVNGRTEPWDFGFTLKLREAQFAGAATLDTRTIWAGALQAFLKESIQLNDAAIDTLKERAGDGLSRFQDYIKRRDQRRTPPPPAAQP